MTLLGADHGPLRPFDDAMTIVVEDQSAIVGGRLDRAGRLVEAEPRLLALQRAAGGDLGEPMAVPALASLARLARTLNVLVSRAAIVAENELVLDLWVRAAPDAEGVALTIGGWEPRVERPEPEAAEARERAFAALESEGEWRCDANLMLVRLDLFSAGFSALPLTECFRFTENAKGELPVLSGLALRRPFHGQPAELRSGAATRLVLHGAPAIDAEGRFAGFAGGYRLVSRPPVSPPPPPEPADRAAFSSTLDNALRRPLGRIIAEADQITAREEGPLRQDYVSYASDIASAGRHLLGLVDDLSDLQAADGLDFKIESEKIDLADIARRAAGLLAVRAHDRGVRIDAPDADEMLPAKGDFRRVLQILVNLIGNAIRYSEGAPVWVRSEDEGDLSAIVVCDQGRGIALDDHERIFGKFERLDPAEPDTTGLGLYISRQLARAMGGDITVDSAPGMGARFILTLPKG